MSKDKACISAVKEVCQRCPLYKENCGMLDYPDQCSTSGRYIDGYHQAEKDLELTWEDVQTICKIESEVDAQYCKDGVYSIPIDDVYKEVLRRFNEQKRNKA